MFRKRFFASWMFSTLGMYLLSYFWHGVVLTDFEDLNYPLRKFLFLDFLGYLIIGYVVAKIFDVPYFYNKYKKSPIKRGAVSGAYCGIAFFIIFTVIGVPFYVIHSFKHQFYNFSWQILEQGAGGIIVAFAHIFIYQDDSMED